MKHLDSKAVWILFFRSFGYLLILAFMFGGMFAQALAMIGLFSAVKWLVLILIVFIGLAYLWAKLSWSFYLYDLAEHGFKKESGVIWKKYITIPYERIQNVDIRRGPIARLLGLSDLQIQTAGSSTQSYVEGRLLGLSKEVAENIRSELVARAQQSKKQGL